MGRENEDRGGQGGEKEGDRDLLQFGLTASLPVVGKGGREDGVKRGEM